MSGQKSSLPLGYTIPIVDLDRDQSCQIDERIPSS
jgi:hypothetical protein